MRRSLGSHAGRLLLLVLPLLLALPADAGDPRRPIDLGIDTTPEWDPATGRGLVGEAMALRGTAGVGEPRP